MSERISSCVNAVLCVGMLAFGLLACGKGELKNIHQEKSGDLTITLMSERGELELGENELTIEFRSASAGQFTDAGHITFTSDMPMPETTSPMLARVELLPADKPGIYRAKASFEMRGLWQFAIGWDGPAGQGKVTFTQTVR
ncbi:MAG: FixH family protein [Acidobacteria bacterium]|nr:FixH family protein [Acidobacteriota bacterium]